uniref:Uncharacterized protein n=1 Tax=Manihot esculenta TaxID=3983 RepID=A0A2C9U991_MANES
MRRASRTTSQKRRRCHRQGHGVRVRETRTIKGGINLVFY